MWNLFVLFIIFCLLGLGFFFDRLNHKILKKHYYDEAWKEYQDMCKDCYYKKRCQELEKDDSNKNE